MFKREDATNYSSYMLKIRRELQANFSRYHDKNSIKKIACGQLDTDRLPWTAPDERRCDAFHYIAVICDATIENTGLTCGKAVFAAGK